jgi:uncharacterized protein involved in outer membrane biogenesis
MKHIANRAFKIILLSLLSILAFILFLMMVSKFSDIRPFISWGSKAFSNYHIQIQEPLDVNYFPDLKVSTKNTLLVKNTNKNAILQLNNIDFQLDSKRLVTEGLFIVNLNINEFTLDIKSNLSGSITGKIDLNGQGNSWGELKKNLYGNLNFIMDNGRWHENDIWYNLRLARSIYKRDETPLPSNHEVMQDFTIIASGSIKNSIFVNDAFKMTMPFTEIDGTGTINLYNREIDYSIEAFFQSQLKEILNLSEAEYLDFSTDPVPIKIRNNSGDITFRPDIEKIFRNEVESNLLKHEDIFNDMIKMNMTQ